MQRKIFDRKDLCTHITVICDDMTGMKTDGQQKTKTRHAKIGNRTIDSCP